MFYKINPTATSAWKALDELKAKGTAADLPALFKEDPDRFSHYSIQLKDILFDYSKNLVNDEIMDQLLKLADQCQLKAGIDAMFHGEIINETERRSVLHTALRNFSKAPVYAEGKDVMPEVKAVLKKMKKFASGYTVENGWATVAKRSSIL